MSTVLIRRSATADLNGTSRAIGLGSTVTLDEKSVPYASASIELPVVDAGLIASIDPRANVRVPVEAWDGYTLRTFDLGLRARPVDHKAKTLTLSLASDEALLQDYGTLVEDKGARAFQASARAVCEYVIGKAIPSSVNQAGNPRASSTALLSASQSGAGSPTFAALSSPGENVGGVGLDTFVRATATTASTYLDVRGSNTNNILLAPLGTHIAVSAWVRPLSITTPVGHVYVQQYDAGGTLLGGAEVVAPVTASGWTRISMTVQRLPSAVRVVPIFRVTGTVPVGARLDATGFVTEQTRRVGPYRDNVLTPAGVDANLTAYWSVTNLIPNPELAVDAAGYIIGTGAGSLTRVASGIPAGSAATALRWAVTAAGDSNVVAATGTTSYPVTSGRWYVFAVDVASQVARNARAVIQWYSCSTLSSQSFGTIVGSDASTFRRAFVIAQAPAGATHGYPYVNTQGNAIGNLHYLSRAMFYEGNEVVPYFHGGSAGGGYTYAWSNTAHASTSTRTPVLERLPDVFTWKPGTTAWDFLVSVITSAGLMLWCDEQRGWHLDAPANRTLVALISISALNTTEGTDDLSRDDGETYATGIVVRYRWRDLDGVQQEAYDTAGTGEKVAPVIDLDGAYPGPGAAAAILARRQGTGRRQDVTAITHIDTTPGMTALISLPGAPDTIGRVAAVTFDLHTGLMDVRHAGLVDIMPGSIASLLGSIDSLVGSIDSL